MEAWLYDEDRWPSGSAGGKVTVDETKRGEIYGEIHSSVIGPGVVIEEGAVVRDSIVMEGSVIKKGAQIERAIIAQDVKIGENAIVGCGEFAPSTFKEKVYNSTLVTIGENSVIPDGVRIGRNTAIIGVTVPSDYEGGELKSGGAIIKASTVEDLIIGQKEGDQA